MIFISQLPANLSFLSDMRIVLAGVIGGIAIFVWTSVAHIALPPGQGGIGEMPNESAVLSAM